MTKTTNTADDALNAALCDYDLHDRVGGGYYIADIAPDSAGEGTAPGSPWDKACHAILEDVRSLRAAWPDRPTLSDRRACVSATWFLPSAGRHDPHGNGRTHRGRLARSRVRQAPPWCASLARSYARAIRAIISSYPS